MHPWYVILGKPSQFYLEQRGHLFFHKKSRTVLIFQITIRFRISWRRSSGGNWCDDDTISNHTLTGSGHIECFSGCTGNVGSLAFLCTDYSTTDDWSSGRNDIIYTVSSTKFSFRYLQNNCIFNQCVRYAKQTLYGFKLLVVVCLNPLVEKSA